MLSFGHLKGGWPFKSRIVEVMVNCRVMLLKPSSKERTKVIKMIFLEPKPENRSGSGGVGVFRIVYVLFSLGRGKFLSCDHVIIYCESSFTASAAMPRAEWADRTSFLR